MADTKISSLTAATTVNAADQFAIVQSSASKMATGTMARGYASNASVATVSAGYAAETYLAGSSVTIPTAGGWKVLTRYVCQFDMTKTAAGTAQFLINVKIGTTGTVSDASVAGGTLGFAVGTAAADTGIFDIGITFRTVGSGTSAVIGEMGRCTHHLAATGLITTGASGTGVIVATSSGFDSTTGTIIGLAITGGASFSGTNTFVQAAVYGF